MFGLGNSHFISCILVLLSSYLPWLNMVCHYFISSMTWYGLLLLYLFHDLIWISIASFILPWLDMELFISSLFFHDLICIIIDIAFLFFHDLIWYYVVYCSMTWYGLSSSFISFPCVDNMFPIGFIWFILGWYWTKLDLRFVNQAWQH